MNKEKPKYNMWQNILFVLGLAWKYCKSGFVSAMLFVLFFSGRSMVQLLIAPTILNQVESMASIPELLLTIAVFCLLLMLVNAGIRYLEENAAFGWSEVRFGLLRMINKKAATTSYPNMLNTNFLHKLSRAQNCCGDNHSAMQEIWMLLIIFLHSSLDFIVFMLVLSKFNLPLLCVVIATTMIGYFASRQINEWDYKHRNEKEEREGRLSYLCNKIEKRTVFKDIHIFGIQDWLEDVWNSSFRMFRAYFVRREQIYIWATVIDTLLVLLRNGIAYVYLINLALKDNLTVAEFLLYFTAISAVTERITSIIGNLISLHAHSLEISIARELLEWPEVFKFEDGEPLESQKNKGYEIELENVSYRYPNGEQNTIRHINLTIHPSEKLAVVGLNGAGKTTLVKLICGFLDPTEGRVLLNGRDIREFNRRDYYRLFSVVFQEFSLLQTDIRENVAQTPGDNADEKRVWECLEMADLAEKVRSLPNGLQTHIGKSVYLDGMDFSGGQIQRLMLARALYKDAPIIALDEPTAALDPIAEHDIYMRYNDLTAGRPAIFISHRLASTRFCDRIIYLVDGAIAEEGTHDHLLKCGGGYAELFAVQSKYYQEGWCSNGE